MKKRFLYSILFAFSFSLMSSICTSDYEDNITPRNNSQEITQIKNTVESGIWIVTSFIDSGQNETNHFNGYDFIFKTDGTLVADDKNILINGSWSIVDTGDYSNSEDDIHFNISFPVSNANNFDDLNEDWKIVLYNNTKIDLIHISGGNGGTDTLTFKKN
jgi:hypothetical protein